MFTVDVYEILLIDPSLSQPTYLCEWEGCPRNQKPFTKRHKMYNHLRTHTGERPFVCQKEGKMA